MTGAEIALTLKPVMRRPSLLALSLSIAFGAVGAPTALGQPARRAAAAFDDGGEARMIAKINEMRAAADLDPLQRHPGLDEAARAHSRDMARHSELVHVSERTGTPAARVRAAGVTAARIGENIAKHATTAGAFEAILGSEAHRAQLFEPGFTHIGLAALPTSGGTYVTQVLAVIEPPAELPPPAVEDTAVPEPPGSAAEPQPTPSEGAEVQDAADVEAVDVAPALDEGDAIPAPPQRTRRPPRLRVPAGHRNVAGYWVHQQGRWWYFPVPRNARPGTLLDHDPTVQGPPPGVDNAEPQALPGRRSPNPRVRVQRRQGRQLRPGVLSPRRGGQIYWY